MKTAVIFDADGVVTSSEFFTDKLETSHGIPASHLAPFFKERFPACIVGEADLKQELQPLLGDLGWEHSVDDFLNFWFESENKIDAALMQEIKLLRQQGYLVCLGTNQERCRVKFMRERMDFGEVFDLVFPSCELNCKKPDPNFYKKVSERLAYQGIERIVFFDDREENVAAATASCWNARLYKSIDSFLDWKKVEGTTQTL